MRRVTLYIEDLTKVSGSAERYQFEAETPHVLPLVFRTVNVAIGAHPDEIAVLTAAIKVIADMLAACTPSKSEGGE